MTPGARDESGMAEKWSVGAAMAMTGSRSRRRAGDEVPLLLTTTTTNHQTAEAVREQVEEEVKVEVEASNLRFVTTSRRTGLHRQRSVSRSRRWEEDDFLPLPVSEPECPPEKTSVCFCHERRSEMRNQCTSSPN